MAHTLKLAQQHPAVHDGLAAAIGYCFGGAAGLFGWETIASAQSKLLLEQNRCRCCGCRATKQKHLLLRMPSDACALSLARCGGILSTMGETHTAGQSILEMVRMGCPLQGVRRGHNHSSPVAPSLPSPDLPTRTIPIAENTLSVALL